MNVIYLCSGFLGNLIIVIYKNNLILRFLKFCNGYFFFIFYLIKLMSGYLLCFYLLVIIFIKRYDRILVW